MSTLTAARSYRRAPAHRPSAGGMRPAEIGDIPGITAVVQARTAWLENQQWLPRERPTARLLVQAHPRALERHIRQRTGDGHPRVWVYTTPRTAVAGVAMLLDGSLHTRWTAAERCERSVWMTETYTDPAYRGLGSAITRWARAIGAQRGASWVRCALYGRRLADHAGRGGWQSVRTVRETGGLCHLMQIPTSHTAPPTAAGPIPGLAELPHLDLEMSCM